VSGHTAERMALPLFLADTRLTPLCSAFPALQGAAAAGAQKFVGYKGSTIAGSAPTCVPTPWTSRASFACSLGVSLLLHVLLLLRPAKQPPRRQAGPRVQAGLEERQGQH
jgi:hypothetical protein